MVRMPADLRDRIKERAEGRGRSMNSEIIATLKEEYPSPAEIEELYAAEIIEWSNKIYAAMGTEREQMFLDMANEWLDDMDIKEIKFAIMELDDPAHRFPATVRLRGSDIPLSEDDDS